MIKRLLSSQLRINMASGVMATVINTAVMLVGYPIYLHFLGYEKYGVWLVLTTVLTFAQLGDIGINQAIIKLVAEDYGRDDIKGIERYVTTALVLLCFSGTVVLILILALKNQIIAAFNLNDENARTVSWLLPYISILSIYVFIVQALNATLSGLGRMDLANYAQSLGRIVAVTVAAVLLYSGRGIESLLIGNIISYVFIQVTSLVCIRRIATIHLLRLDNLNVQRSKRLLSFGGAVFGGSLIGMLLSPFNKLVLSRYAGVSTIPVYEIAYNGSMQVRGLLEAGLRALMPEVSRLSGEVIKYAKDKILQIYHRTMKLVFLFGVPLYGIIIIFSPLLLEIWLGEQFTESLPRVFQIMLIGMFINLVGVPAYYILLGLGMARYTLATNAIISLTSVLIITTIILSGHRLSVETVSWAFLIGAVISSLYLHWKITQKVMNRNINHYILLAKCDKTIASRKKKNHVWKSNYNQFRNRNQ